MKRVFLLLIAVLSISQVRAQEGQIIYKDYDPDLYVYTSTATIFDTLSIDFDQDGSFDFKIFPAFYGNFYHVNYFALSPWEMRIQVENDIYDTIIAYPRYWRPSNSNDEYMFFNAETHQFYTDKEYYFGFRKIIDSDTYHYAWLKAYGHCDYATAHHDVLVFVDRLAYCDIPNYPLRWGQTTMTSIAEDEDDSFVSLYPNPTTGVVNIKGARLRQAEIFNSLGQRIALVQSSDDEFSVDMKGLPSGLYYAAIIDAEGRRYTRKIVKE